MKQQALAIAAATMLTIGLGIANAEQIVVLDQGVSPEIATCGSDQNPCLLGIVTDGRQVTELNAEGGPDMEQQDVMNDSSDENEADDQEMAMAEASDDSNGPALIIFLQ
jgi:hypothetical protein